MIIEKKTFEDGSTFMLWQVTEEVDELLEKLDNDPFIAEQISHFTSIKRKCEYLASRCMLKEHYGELTNIGYYPSGRPFIEGHQDTISISHTGEWVTVLLHPTKRCGIDIERLTDKLVRVKSKYLSPEEMAFIDFQCEKPQLAIMWAAKEALYKLIDIQGLDPLKNLHIRPFLPYLDGRITATETKSHQTRQFELEYLVRPQYVLVRVIE